MAEVMVAAVAGGEGSLTNAEAVEIARQANDVEERSLSGGGTHSYCTCAGVLGGVLAKGTRTPTRPISLPEIWAERAEALRQHGGGVADGPAHIWAAATAELNGSIRAQENEVLTIRQAADESGYSEDHLRRLLRDGKVQNRGTKHSPRIRRGDLPRKPTSSRRERAAAKEDHYTTDRLFRDIANSKKREG
ncbi:hypothetical protein BH23GEM5_BH23GEM5_20710 [soil metagenome]